MDTRAQEFQLTQQCLFMEFHRLITPGRDSLVYCDFVHNVLSNLGDFYCVCPLYFDVWQYFDNYENIFQRKYFIRTPMFKIAKSG